MPFTFDATYDQVNPLHRERFESGRASIRQDYEVPDEMRALVADYLRGHSPETVALFVHLLMSASPSRQWWVPVPAKLMRKVLPRAYGEVSTLREKGLLEVIKDYGPGISMQYRVPDDLRREFFAAGRRDVVDKLGALVDGAKGAGSKVRKSKLYDSSRNPLGDPMRGALKVLQEGRFNAGSLLSHLRVQGRRLEKAWIDGAGNGPDSEDSTAHTAWLEKRLQNDIRCIYAVLEQRPEPIGGGWCRYRLAYEPTITGRLSQVGGGLQGATRATKKAAYDGDPEIKNYDIRSSQATILREMLRESGVEAPWLDKYLEADKSEYADRVGVDVDTWKTCLYAVLYGASLVRPHRFHQSRGEVREALHEYAASVQVQHPEEGSVENIALKRYEALLQELGPFYRRVRTWRKTLVNEWLPSQWVHNRAGKTIRNEAGALLRKEEFSSWSGRDQENRLAAFVIQGREAAFIHHLTVLMPAYHTLPISNEHDGLVVVGAVEDQAIQEAREAAGTSYLSLVEKDIG